MKKKLVPIKLTCGCFLLALILSVISGPLSFAQEFADNSGPEFTVSASLLFVTGTINPNNRFISYTSFTHQGEFINQIKQSIYRPEQLETNEIDDEKVIEDNDMFKLGKKIQQATRYFFKYFDVDDISADDSLSKCLLESKIQTEKIHANDFEFDLSMNLGYDAGHVLKMSAIKLRSYWYRTYLNTTYHYDKNELAFGLSSKLINNYLPGGMTVEFQANPMAGFGAILFAMSL